MLNDAIVERVRAEIAAILPEVVSLRHRIHEEPEIGFDEHRTRAKLAAFLDGTGLTLREPLIGTDLIAELPGRSPTLLALRADIDALPIMETSGAPYASRIPGMMHACGHDAHASMLAGAATVLDRLRDELPVSLRFVFQPAEEMVAGGAKLIAAGAADGAVAAYALHGWPGPPMGSVNCKTGPLFAVSATYEATFSGRGGHAAQPHLTRNPNAAMARAAVALQELHDQVQAESGSVISVSILDGGSATNVIPGQTRMAGTIRYLDPSHGTEICERIRAAIETATAQTPDITADVSFDCKYRFPVLNSPPHVARVAELAKAYAPGGYAEVAESSMGAEDFAFFLQDRPGAMFLIGLGPEQPGLHHPAFNFPDAALPAGILMFCLLALSADPDTLGE